MNIEIITWRDACDFRGVEKDFVKNLPTVTTVGINMHEDDEKVILINHYDERKENTMTVDDEKEGVCIPKPWILTRKIIGIKE